MKLSISDYKKILKFYKLSIPKKSKNIRKKAEKIIANKFCSCIKKVQQKFKKEGIAIGICTKSVINRKGYKRSTFRCKKRRTIKLQKGGKRRKNTRKKRGGHHLYKRLGVSKYASKKQIKKAYNNLKGNRKSTKKLREAYKILSNKKTRKEYNNKYREAMKK